MRIALKSFALLALAGLMTATPAFAENSKPAPVVAPTMVGDHAVAVTDSSPVTPDVKTDTAPVATPTNGAPPDMESVDHKMEEKSEIKK